MNSSRCSVVVVGYQGAKWLPDCLTTLARASARRLHLVLVDNGGNGDLDQLPLSAFDTQVVPTPRPLGFAEANNCGLVAAGLDSDVVCFLNQDTLSESGWLDACLDCLEDHADIGAVAPLLTSFDGTAWDEGFAYCVRDVQQLRNARPGADLTGHFEVPLLTAAAMVIHTDLLRRIGPFDPVFGSYYEDFDLCRRVGEAGFRMAICGPAMVRHFGGSATASPVAERKRTRQLVRNRLIHRLRCAGRGRGQQLCRYLAIEFPYQLGRCLAGTASAPPLSAFLNAHRDLVPLLDRLISESRDRRAFEAYLTQLRWTRSGDRVEAVSA